MLDLAAAGPQPGEEEQARPGDQQGAPLAPAEHHEDRGDRAHHLHRHDHLDRRHAVEQPEEPHRPEQRGRFLGQAPVGRQGDAKGDEEGQAGSRRAQPCGRLLTDEVRVDGSAQ